MAAIPRPNTRSQINEIGGGVAEESALRIGAVPVRIMWAAVSSSAPEEIQAENNAAPGHDDAWDLLIECRTAVVAIRTKAAREIPLDIEALIKFLQNERRRAVLLVDAKIADACTQAQIRVLRGDGDHVQGSGHRIRHINS